MPVSNNDDGKTRRTRKPKSTPPIRPQVENFSEFGEELTEAERQLQALDIPADIVEKVQRFRETYNLTPENLKLGRENGFAIADRLSLMVSGLYSDALEAEELQKNYNSIANSQAQYGELNNVRRVVKNLEKKQDDILIPLTKSQVKTLWEWTQKNVLLILVIALLAYVGYDKLTGGKANGDSSSSAGSNNSAAVQSNKTNNSND